MRTFPALEISWSATPDPDIVDRLLAVVDDASPTAVEEEPFGVRVFFSTEADRDDAAALVIDAMPNATVTSLLVPDDGWAERSQAALKPVRVGEIVVAPPWAIDEVSRSSASDGTQTSVDAQSANGRLQPASPLVITIQPSMGFGTGHHASTRLCLALLQRHVPRGGAVIDIGTGSGVLAIAACRMGAASALGIDVDRDALTAAAENVGRNGVDALVTLASVDITCDGTALPRRFDLAFANITGAMLQRHASRVVSAVEDSGIVIASGFQSHERADVIDAFRGTGMTLVDVAEEDDWVAAAFRRSAG